MTSAQTNKEDPGFSEVSNVNIKCEATDHSGKLGLLKITNVFSITKIKSGTETSGNLKTSSRPSYKLRNNRGVKISKDPAPEVLPSGRRYGFRKRTNATQIKHLESPNNSPSPAENKSKKLKSIKSKGNVTCDICAIVFFSLESLEEHVVDAHVVDKNFPLAPNTSFKDRNLIVQASDEQLQTQNSSPSPAEINSHLQRVLSCDFCSLLFFSVESLEEHVADTHVEDKEFDCTKCDKSFISQERLDLHSAEHEKGQEAQSDIKCPLCYKAFPSTRQRDLKRHMTAHQAERPFKCKLCPKSYVSGTDLERHEMNQHGKEKKYKCSKCPKAFAYNYALQDHVRTHSDYKGIVCENCRECFKTKRALRRHRTHCNRPSSKQCIKMAQPKQREQTRQCHKCPICFKTFTLPRVLRRHKHTHMEIRKCKCKLCPKSYITPRELEIHEMNQHGKPKPFKCPLCPNSFARNCALKDHLRTHSIKQPIGLVKRQNVKSVLE